MRIKMAASALGCMAMFGCAGIVPEFSLYSGRQQNWPTQPGSFVNTRFALPIYWNGYPERPYEVLGIVEGMETPAWISVIAHKAKALGADAMIVTDRQVTGSVGVGNTFVSGSSYGRTFNANATSIGATRALYKASFTAIKWK